MTQAVDLPNGAVQKNGKTMNDVKVDIAPNSMQQLEVLRAVRLALAACLQVSCTDAARFEGVLRPYSQKDVEKLR